MLKEETRVKNLIIVGVIAILVGATFVPVVHGHLNKDTIKSAYTAPEDSRLPTTSQDEMVTIVTQKYGPFGVEEVPLEVTPLEAEKIAQDLEKLKENIESRDKTGSFLLVSKLRQIGVFQDDTVFDLILNYFNGGIIPYMSRYLNRFVNNSFCFVIGSGTGTFWYPFDDFVAVFAFLAYFITIAGVASVNMSELAALFIFAMIGFSLVSDFLLHYLPRFILPHATLFIHTGALTTIGLNETITYSSEFHRIDMRGFVGLTVHFINSLFLGGPFFCLGFSLGVSGEQ